MRFILSLDREVESMLRRLIKSSIHYRVRNRAQCVLLHDLEPCFLNSLYKRPRSRNLSVIELVEMLLYITYIQ